MSYLKTIVPFLVILFSVFMGVEAQAAETVITTPGTNAPVTSTTTVSTTPNITAPAPAPSQIQGHAMIVSPAPSAKEVIVTPEGYVNCFTIESGWYKDSWIPEHRVCQYQNVPGQAITYEGVAWIDSYWACTQYTGTACTKWEWKPGHWVKTLEVY